MLVNEPALSFFLTISLNKTFPELLYQVNPFLNLYVAVKYLCLQDYYLYPFMGLDLYKVPHSMAISSAIKFINNFYFQG